MLMLIGKSIIDLDARRKVHKREDRGITLKRLLFSGLKRVVKSFFISRIKATSHEKHSRNMWVLELVITASPKPKPCRLKGQRILRGQKGLSPIKGCDKVATK